MKSRGTFAILVVAGVVSYSALVALQFREVFGVVSALGAGQSTDDALYSCGRPGRGLAVRVSHRAATSTRQRHALREQPRYHFAGLDGHPSM
jgi:hypothetical protein